MIGERGGSTATFEEAKTLLEARKAHWSGAIRQAILESLEIHGRFHAADLLVLGIPADCKNCVGAQVMALVRQGLMAETGERISSNDPAGHGRRSAVYQITPAGIAKLHRANQGCRGEEVEVDSHRGKFGGPETGSRTGGSNHASQRLRAAASSGKGAESLGSGGSVATTALPTLFELEANRSGNYYEGEAE
jgi:hypothetical protein